MVFYFELHEAHVGWVCELSDDAKSWEQSREREYIEGHLQNERRRKNIHFRLECEIIEQVWERRPEEGLDIDDGLCVSHVVLFCNHGALLVNYHHCVSKSHSTSQQAVQTIETE